MDNFLTYMLEKGKKNKSDWCLYAKNIENAPNDVSKENWINKYIAIGEMRDMLIDIVAKYMEENHIELTKEIEAAL